MLSSEFGFCAPSAISIDRQSRQRRQFTTEDLDDSIKLRGIINPLIITRDFELKAGERRLTSALKVGLALVPYRFVDTLDPIELSIIELEENLKRSDLPWRDEVRAIGQIHELYVLRDSEWAQQSTALALGMKPAQVSQYLRVFRDLDSPKIAGAPGMTSAYNLLIRVDDRKIGDAVSDILEASLGVFGPGRVGAAGGTKPATVEISGGLGPSPEVPGLAPSPGPYVAPAQPTLPPVQPSLADTIQNKSFLLWAPTYSGPRFNFIHCDFPYGINAFDGSLGASGANSSRDIDLGSAQAQLYSDSPETYWALIDCLCANLDRLMSPSAHLVFWFSMHHYEATLAEFASRAPSLIFNPIPLIWLKSDNRGVISDARRGPRNIYETALFAYREDRPVIRSTSNAYSCPTDKTYHHSTKPEPMLRYFFQMFVDETTRMLDPTCGGGSAVRAAESLGAKSTLGLEIDPEHCETAQKALRNFRVLRKASK